MRYRDFSTGAQAATAEARIMPYIGLEHGEFWNPALMIRRQGTLPLQSAFLSTLEVFEAEPLVRQARRLEVRHDAGGVSPTLWALEITLADGRTDLCSRRRAPRRARTAPRRARAQPGLCR
jgi:hypothetical protein